MQLVSKFKFWKVYVLVSISFAVFMGIGILMLWLDPGTARSPVLLKIFAVIAILGSIYVLYSYIRALPVVRINESGIRLKSLFISKEFCWDGVESVSYTGKNSSYMAYPTESMMILMKDGSKGYVFYPNYSNGHLLMQAVQSYHNHGYLAKPLEENTVRAEELEGEVFSTYKGIAWLSYRGLLMVAPIAFFIIAARSAIINAPDTRIIIPIVFAIVLYVLFSLFCFYIQLSDNYLVIRNHFLPFLTYRYKLSDVRVIVLETVPKWPNCIRIINHSFRYSFFPCGTLRDKDWQAFISRVEKRKVKLKNEIF